MSQRSRHPEPDVPAIRLFVYGTLRRGEINHYPYCKDAVSIEPATVRGRLHQLPSGLLVLEVPKTDILAVGTNDPIADALTQQSIVSRARGSRQSGDSRSVARYSGDPERTVDGLDDHEGRDSIPNSPPWKFIPGELITFDDPVKCLPPIDRLEGFDPGGISLYRRMLVPAQIVDSPIPVWTYVIGDHPFAD